VKILFSLKIFIDAKEYITLNVFIQLRGHFAPSLKMPEQNRAIRGYHSSATLQNGFAASTIACPGFVCNCKKPLLIA